MPGKHRSAAAAYSAGDLMRKQGDSRKHKDLHARQSGGERMAGEFVEVSINGRWRRVPSLKVDGTTIIVRNGLIKVASIHDEAWTEAEIAHPESIVAHLKSAAAGVRADVFTFTERPPIAKPKYCYPMEWDSVAAIPLATAVDWWQKLPQVARKNVRRAAKRGIITTVRRFDDEMVKHIVELNNDSPFTQGQRSRHFGKTFTEVKRDYISFANRCDYICAHLDDQIVGVLKLVYCGNIGAILQLLTKRDHYDKRPANALIHKAVECCVQRKLSFLTYGRYRYGNQDRTSLLDFKVRNGFEEILVPRYYVPLSLKGSLMMRLGLHRELIAVIPRPVIALKRRLRAKWLVLRPSREKRNVEEFS